MKITARFNTARIREQLKAERARVKQAIKDGIEETDGPALVEESYSKSPLRVRSGRLKSSFQEENSETQKIVGSDVDYSRIQDLGGLTGRNHRTFIKPTYYFTKARVLIMETILKNIRKRLNK